MKTEGSAAVVLVRSKVRLPRRLLLLVAVLLTLGWPALLLPSPAWSAARHEGLITHGGYLVDDGTGTRQYRARELFAPASTLKLLTCLAALETLGLDYRFETHIFVDEGSNLYIKGYGDPFLTSEAVLDISRKLYELGIRRIETIFLDDSAFALEGPTAGSENTERSYDAPNSALAVNFNALPVQVDQNGTIASGEPQTPSLPVMQEIGARLSTGSHRVNLTAFPCIPTISPTLRYTGELFTAQLQQAGIAVKGCFEARRVPQHLPPRLIYQNPLPLTEMVRACLKGSNNFIANQLYLTCGLKAAGQPATWGKSRDFFAGYITKVLRMGPTELQMVEGSGLSRQNQVTAAALVKVLRRFRPFADLLTRHEGILLKSGTMSNIFCYAGYYEEGNGLVPFAILLNQEKNTRKDLLKLLQKVRMDTASVPRNERSASGK